MAKNAYAEMRKIITQCSVVCVCVVLRAYFTNLYELKIAYTNRTNFFFNFYLVFGKQLCAC